MFIRARTLAWGLARVANPSLMVIRLVQQLILKGSRYVTQHLQMIATQYFLTVT